MNRKLGSIFPVCLYNIMYPYMKYMLKRLGTIAGYEYILCSHIFRGTWLLDVYSDLI